MHIWTEEDSIRTNLDLVLTTKGAWTASTVSLWKSGMWKPRYLIVIIQRKSSRLEEDLNLNSPHWKFNYFGKKKDYQVRDKKTKTNRKLELLPNSSNIFEDYGQVNYL